MCNSRETYSTFFAQSGGRLSVINAQLAMIVHMITILNNLRTVVKEAAYFIAELKPLNDSSYRHINLNNSPVMAEGSNHRFSVSSS